MPNKLGRKDYEVILDFYGIDHTKKTKIKDMKASAEDIILSKLCRCIGKVDSKPTKDKKLARENKSKAVAICKKGVLNRKGLTSSKFSCGTKSISISKQNNKPLTRRMKGVRKHKAVARASTRRTSNRK